LELSGRTRVCAVLGDPIAHSLSPTMHNAAFEALGLDFVYLAFRVQTEGLESAISGARQLGIHGLNITMPCKEAVATYLDAVDPAARTVGAVNTVVNDNGVTLIREGTELTNPLIERLKNLGIEQIVVQGCSRKTEGKAEKPLSVLERELEARFRPTQSIPVMRQLKEIFLRELRLRAEEKEQ